ncbi:DJ-1/PfpI family protein [Caldimonas tepidiphila]|uniref:DJ-1/PfpI family protein n=1 Tax=Caldimonas tepidiphila TaxID=2315841 RepID=UPI000E5AE790|nr:DJ-1/PfpI family protein [Caldimonas tepidiphila]
MSLKVAILLFDEVEVLDFAGPYEVFTTASRLARRGGAAAPFEVFTVAAEPGPRRARAGLTVQADHGFASHPPVDLLVVPGGVVDAELRRPQTLDWLRHQAPSCRLLASVCTGSFLLAAAGLLDGLPATTHWEDVEDLRALRPGLEVLDGPRWVDAGRVVSSAGISAGIDMSLHLVERLAGRGLALRTARQMDVDWLERGVTLGGTRVGAPDTAHLALPVTPRHLPR